MNDGIDHINASLVSATGSQPNSSVATPIDSVQPTVMKTVSSSRLSQEEVIETSPNGRYLKLNVILGKGAYKVVWKALDREEGVEVAWNCFQTTRAEFTEFSQEIDILKKVRHPSIINFHDSWFHNNEFVFITELMTSGTLREYIQRLKSPNINIVKKWCRQILKGLLYLHSQHPPIIHRDIKCDNIFINGSHGEVKIGDMGTAKMKLGKKYTIIGTPEFMAPEMYEERGYNEKVDVYAFGMCLLEMVTGEYPYSECKNAAQIYKKVSQGIKPDCLMTVSGDELLSVINGCLAPENSRLSVQQILEHPFLSEEPDVVLISADDQKVHLTLQVVFKGMEKMSVKFEFNTDTDTAAEVVNEMIEEEVLPEKYRGLVTFEINRIIRDIAILTDTSGTTEGMDVNTPWRRDNLRIELSKCKSDLADASIYIKDLELKIKELDMKRLESESLVSGFKAEIERLHGELEVVRKSNSNSGNIGSSSQGMHGNPANTSHSAPNSQSSSPQGLGIQTNNVSGSGSSSAVISSSIPAHSTMLSSNASSQMNGVVGGNSSHRNSEDTTSITSENGMPNRKHSSSMEMEFDLFNKEYLDSSSIKELVFDIAIATNRGEDKAREWFEKLKRQDIESVGDLRALHDEDWANLSLTVFASRALKNAISKRSLFLSSPKTSTGVTAGSTTSSS